MAVAVVRGLRVASAGGNENPLVPHELLKPPHGSQPFADARGQPFGDGLGRPRGQAGIQIGVDVAYLTARNLRNGDSIIGGQRINGQFVIVS
ncbi:hypothetical protein [Arthrobacter monumenti]